MKLLRNITLICSLAAGVPAMAQQTWQDSETDIGNEQVVILKERQNELPPANRSFQKVPPQQLNVQKDELRYNFSDFNLQLKPVDPTVRVLTIKTDPPKPYHNRYIKGSLGNYLSSHLDGWITSDRNPSYLWGLNVNHRAAARGPVDGANSSFSRNKAEAHGSYFAKAFTLDSKIYAQRNRYNFFGYDEEALDPDREDLKQVFNLYGARIGLANTETENFGASLGVSADHTGSFYDISENMARLDGKLRFELSDALGFQLESDLLMSRFNAAETSLNRNLFRIAPAFAFKFAPIKLLAGFNIAYENDTAANAGMMHFYPRVELSVAPFENIEATLGLEGNMQPMTYRSMISENPFVLDQIALLHSNKTIDFYGSIKGRAAGGLGFLAGFSAANYRNMHFFVNSHVDTTRFDVIYNPGNTALVNVFGELSYHFSNRFHSSMRADYFGYRPDHHVAHAWHKPSYKVEWSGSYNLYEKILFSANTYVLGGIVAREIRSEDQAVNLPAVVDIGLGVEYLFSRQASAFLRADNLLSQEFQRFYNYPSRRLVLSLGASYAF